MDNLRYGRLRHNGRRIIAAAKMAGADGLSRISKRNTRTEVGEGGGLLSGRGKIAPDGARTSFWMDEFSCRPEALISAAGIPDGPVALSHRLSTIKACRSRIIVIEAGEITENGTHAGVDSRTQPLYYDLGHASVPRGNGAEL